MSKNKNKNKNKNNKLLSKLTSVKMGDRLPTLIRDSDLFHEPDLIDTGYPGINLALSGRLDGGLDGGLTIFAGPSKHFKSAYLCVCMAAFLKKHPDGYVFFYDNEKGVKESYLENFGVDVDRIVRIFFHNIEELKQHASQTLEKVTKGEDNVMFVIDSIGNAASKKEIDDALSGNVAADMTRAKQLKSFGRIISSEILDKNIPFLVINHTYQTQETYSKPVMSGGTGLMYNADTVLFVGKRTEKDGKDVVGHNFDLTAHKSRFVKEHSKFPINVTYDGGIEKYSGIFDLALNFGFIKQFGAWYQLADAAISDPKKRRSEIEGDVDYMESLLVNPKFIEQVSKKYLLPIIGSPVLEEDEENESHQSISPTENVGREYVLEES